MLVCTTHYRSYVPALKRWFAVDPKALEGIQRVTTVTEGTCDECQANDKAPLFTPFPDLFIHERLTP